MDTSRIPSSAGNSNMRANLKPLLLLVRDKYLEEQEGITTSTTADRYNEACRKFPATMRTVHYIWARELYATLSATPTTSSPR
jgi:hypothetical protein